MAQEASSTRSAQGAAPPRQLDINAETYPFDVVQRLIDRAAYFNLFSTPEPPDASVSIAGGGTSSSTIGFRIRESVSALTIGLPAGEGDGSRRASAAVGHSLGTFEHRWMLIPDRFDAFPGREPPQTVLDPARRQRFVMLDSRCTFDSGDGFRGFGTGRTFPMSLGGHMQLWASGVGTILDGFGRFEGREGTYAYNGLLSPERGFVGNLLIRVIDPNGDLSHDGSSPSRDGREAERGVTYAIFRGQKRDKLQHTEYQLDGTGQVVGLKVSQELRAIGLGVTSRRSELRTFARLGPRIGSMTADIAFNLANPGAPGTPLSPIPFQSYNRYTFVDRVGRIVGGFDADGNEGRTFNLQLAGAPGQAALRFAGFGPIVNGSGRFAGIEGLMTDNSAVGIAPHALATLYVLRIVDEDGRFRAALEAVGQ